MSGKKLGRKKLTREQRFRKKIPSTTDMKLVKQDRKKLAEEIGILNVEGLSLGLTEVTKEKRKVLMHEINSLNKKGILNKEGIDPSRLEHLINILPEHLEKQIEDLKKKYKIRSRKRKQG